MVHHPRHAPAPRGRPPHPTAPSAATGPVIGRALLAHAPAAVQNDVLNRPIQRHTPFTLTDSGQLRRVLAQIRPCGYAVSDRQLSTDTLSVAAPVTTTAGEVTGAVSVVVRQRIHARRSVGRHGPHYQQRPLTDSSDACFLSHSPGNDSFPGMRKRACPPSRATRNMTAPAGYGCRSDSHARSPSPATPPPIGSDPVTSGNEVSNKGGDYGRMMSRPPPPSRMSFPVPPQTKSSPPSPCTMSSPEPPSRMSRPSPPMTRSSPGPAYTVSSPP